MKIQRRRGKFEQDAVAYEEDTLDLLRGKQSRRRCTAETVEANRQFSFDFGDTEPGRPQPDPGRQNLPRIVGSRPYH